MRPIPDFSSVVRRSVGTLGVSLVTELRALTTSRPLPILPPRDFRTRKGTRATTVPKEARMCAVTLKIFSTYYT